MTGWMPAGARSPVSAAGDVAVIAPLRGNGRRAAGPALPSSFAGAVVAGDGGALAQVGRAAFLKDPRFPALLLYSHGRTAFCCRAGRGSSVLSCAGSPAAATGVVWAVSAVLPVGVRTALSGASLSFRTALAASVADRSGAAAEAFGIVESECRIVHARGELDEYFVWSYATADGGFAVAGFTARPSTLTLLFPYLPAAAVYSAQWIDDGLDYYVKDGLEARPSTVTRATKAVVKTNQRGGFLLRLCLRP